MAATKEEVWDSFLATIRDRTSRESFEKHFANITLQRFSPDEVIFEVADGASAKHLEETLLPSIEDAFLDISGSRPVIRFLTRPPETTAPHGGSPRQLELFRLDGTAGIALNPNYIFDNFIIGPSNMLAHAAAKAVSEYPGEAYNPLFVHSAVGMGKTHLLHAICHTLLARQPSLRILYVSCAEFITSFSSAVQHGDIDGFRARFMSLDILLIDDIHFLANREQTQEEFFQIFNFLYNTSKQIVLSSDSPPQEIPRLEERLVSRFKWGFVTEIEPPTYETRLNILRQKAEIKGHRFPENVLEFLASRIDTNIRELEGAITKLVGYAALLNRTVDLDAAREIFPDLDLPKSKKRVSVDEIYEAVVNFYKVPLATILSKDRSKSVARARQAAMYLMREFTNYSLEEIGSHFGGRDHSTVKHAYEKIKGEIVAVPETQEEVRYLSNLLHKKMLKTN